MKEMAGILISDTVAKWMELGGEAERGKKLRDVAGFCGKRESLRMLGLVARKKMMVFLERGTAAGGVGDDCVDFFEWKSGEIVSSELARGFPKAGVRGKRAAAKLILGNNHFASIGGEHPDGGFVKIGKRDVGNAAGEKGHACTALPHGWKGFAEALEEKFVVDRREQAFTFSKAKQLEDADTARDGLQARALIKAEKTSGVFNEMRSGKKVTEEKVAKELGEPGTLVIALDARPGMFDKFSILYARGAGRFAGAAIKTSVDVNDEGVRDARGRFLIGKLALRDVDHLMDAAARRIRFQIPETIGGAGVEAEAAVNAPGIVFVGGSGARNGLQIGHGRVR